MVWEPKTCCCGASIKTGTLILGWMGLIGSALNVLSMLRMVVFSREDFVNICQNVTQDVDAELCADTVIGVIISAAMTSVLGVAICAMLLWGVNKFKPMMMLPYLTVQGIGLVSFGIISVAAFLFLAYCHHVFGAFVILILCGGLMFLEVYFFLVVRVCYKEVKQHSLAMMGASNIAYVEQQDIPYKM